MVLSLLARPQTISLCLYKPRALYSRARSTSLASLVLQTESEQQISCGPLSAVKVPRKPGVDARLRPVVFLHGAWHGTWHYRGLQEILANRGHDSYALQLKASRLKLIDAHMADVAAALKELSLSNPVLIGHSQGGFIIQLYMHMVDPTLPDEQRVSAIGLVGTGRLGDPRVLTTIPSALPSVTSFLRLLVTARVGADDFKKTFALPSTTETTITGKKISLDDFIRLSASMPEDGTVGTAQVFTHRWANKKPPRITVPSLVVKMEHDHSFGDDPVQDMIKQYGSDVLNVANQAHCFLDPGWEETFAKPLAEWLEHL